MIIPLIIVLSIAVGTQAAFNFNKRHHKPSIKRDTDKVPHGEFYRPKKASRTVETHDLDTKPTPQFEI